MREIKFRAWDTKYKEISYHPMIQSDGTLLYQDDMGQLTQDLDQRFIVQQYTGFKDINGVEIYEGDYVLYPHKSGGGFTLSEERTDWIQCEVKWKAGGLAAYWGHNDCNIVTFNFKQFIVVRNIFEGVDK